MYFCSYVLCFNLIFFPVILIFLFNCFCLHLNLLYPSFFVSILSLFQSMSFSNLFVIAEPSHSFVSQFSKCQYKQTKKDLKQIFLKNISLKHIVRKMSGGENVWSGNSLSRKCPVGKVSVREVSNRRIFRSRKCPSEKCQSGNCPHTHLITWGTVQLGNCPHTHLQDFNFFFLIKRNNHSKIYKRVTKLKQRN